MREFGDIGSFLRFMETMPERVAVAAHAGLERAGKIIEKEAKAEIGIQQLDAGPFEAWQPLSSATMDGFRHEAGFYIPGKEELGFTGRRSEQDPLLRTGQLHDSIEHTVDGHTVTVGSDDEIAVYQELGTPNARYPIPPRSFLGGAAVRKTDDAVDASAGAVAAAIAGLPPRRAAIPD